MSDSKFKVIVVGGGPVGLTAAHILAKAGIDFVVLERYHTVTADVGASVALWAPTLRVLDQLQILKPLEPLMNPLRRKVVLTHDGNVYARNQAFTVVGDNHGYDGNMFHRHQLLKGIFDNLSPEDQAKVFTNKHVTAIESLDNSVRVSTADGSMYEGDMVIGADGVHSTVRSLMAFPAGSSSLADAAHPFEATYRVLFGNTPKSPLVDTTVVYDSHGTDLSSQLFAGKDRMWFFVYEKLAEKTREKKSYTAAEADAYAEAHGDLHIAPKLTLREAYASRNGSGLTNLEEGILPQWSAGRTVLVGDAAHKVTPNLGWGYNSGVMDLVALINPLRKALVASADQPLSTEALAKVFATYQAERMAFMTKIFNLSATITRTSAWATWLQQALDQHVLPAIGADELVSTRVIGPMVSSAPVLYWLAEENFAEGKIPWKHRSEVDSKGAALDATEKTTHSKALLPVALTAGAVFASWTLAHHGIPSWLVV